MRLAPADASNREAKKKKMLTMMTKDDRAYTYLLQVGAMHHKLVGRRHCDMPGEANESKKERNGRKKKEREREREREERTTEKERTGSRMKKDK